MLLKMWLRIAVRNFMQPYENPAVPMQDCSPMEQLLQQDLLWMKEAAASRTSFKDVHATWVQLKSVGTIQNRNQCVCAVIFHAHNAQVSHQEKIGVWSGAYLKRNTLFLMTDYFCDEDPTCGDCRIFSCQSLPSLKNFPFFSVLIFFCYIEYTFGYILLLSPMH